MELPLLYLTLLLLPVSAEVLRVNPDSDQFFSRELITLSCDESWSVKRTRTSIGSEVESCGYNLGFGNSDGSTCFLYNPNPSDSGVYWCESAAGARSPQRPISVADKVTMEEVGQVSKLREEVNFLSVMFLLWGILMPLAGVSLLWCQCAFIKGKEPNNNKDKDKNSFKCSTPEHPTEGLLHSKV